MHIRRNRFTYQKGVRRKRFFLAVVVLVTVAGSLSAFSLLGGNSNGRSRIRGDLLRFWEIGSFGDVYRLTRDALAYHPLDYFLLTMHRFSAYQLGISQIDSRQAMAYFDACIRALRKAMLLRDSNADGRLFYVLGKAYFHKGDGFADSAVRYLERARVLGHRASDIPEFLGLAYAAIGDYLGSVIAFAEALETTRPSAPLLFSIAESYVALAEFEKARAYLMRCISVSMDSRTTLRARLFLSDVLRMLGDVGGAMGQLVEILEETGENADARFQLGELYALQGDNVRARAEWRRAVSADPTHLKARTRLSL